MRRDIRKKKEKLSDDLERLKECIARLDADSGDTNYGDYKSETIFKNIFDNSSDGILVVDIGSRNIRMANSALCRMLGYQHDEIVQLNISQIHPAESMHLFSEEFEQHAFGEKALARDVPVKRKDGSIFYADINTLHIIQKGEKQLVGIFRDISDRIYEKEDLKKNQDIYKAIFDNTADAIVYLNKWGIILDVNNRVEEIFGYKKEQLKYRHFTNVGSALPYDSLQEFNRFFQKMILNGKVAEPRELEVKHLRGHKLIVEQYSRLVFEDNKVKGIVVLLRDITARKNAEKALQKSEEMFRSLTSRIPGMVYIARNDWSVDFITNSEKICGYSPPEFYNGTINWFDIIHPLDKSRISRESAHFVTPDKSISQQYRIITKSGDIHWVEDNKTIEYNHKGIISAVKGIVFDITEREKIKESLFEERNKLQTILEIMPGGVTIRDLDYNILYENGYITEAFGNHIGEKCYRAYEGQDKICEECPVMLAYQDGRAHTSLRKVVMSSGEIEYWENIANPIRDNKGNIVSCLEINLNVTERTTAREQLYKFREEIAHKEQLASIGTLSAMAAHELAQPLTVLKLIIENAISALESDSHTEAMTENLKSSLSEIENINTVIRRIRSYARKSTKSNITGVNVRKVAEKIVNLLNEGAKQAGVKLILEDFSKLPLLYIDEKDLEQLFFCLVMNSIQAGTNGHNYQVRIKAEHNSNHIEMQFIDNCSGIEPKILHRIYEPFFTTKPEDAGTGLGLSIVQEIVNRAGGKIRVESVLSEGTTFFVQLPVKKY